VVFSGITLQIEQPWPGGRYEQILLDFSFPELSPAGFLICQRRIPQVLHQFWCDLLDCSFLHETECRPVQHVGMYRRKTGSLLVLVAPLCGSGNFI
jgi:hypothetical protein